MDKIIQEKGLDVGKLVIPMSIKMKVLFVSSGNLKNFDVAPFIKVQGDSLKNQGTAVSYFKIQGKGPLGYFSNIQRLRKELRDKDYDLIHAHFTLSAWVAVLSFPKIPIVLSLMGTDAYGRVEKVSKSKFRFSYLTLLTYLIQPFTRKIISKSPNIEKVVWQKRKSYLLPNGVDLEKFFPHETGFREKLNFDPLEKYVLFLGNTQDPRKNFRMLEQAKTELKKSGINIISPYPIDHASVFEYLNSVDVLVMCSIQEGSPNVVKEGMACNCKGVFTDVGDVSYLIENTSGYLVCDFNTSDLVKKIKEVIDIPECNGRDRLIEIGLDHKIVAKKLKEIYSQTLKLDHV